MLKIWGRENSNNVRKVLWAADELKLPYQHIRVGGAFGGTDEPTYRAMNPNGLVPCIQDDGFVLWESNAIVRYLSAKHGTLWPSDPAARAVGDKWMDWTTGAFAPAFRDAFWNLLRVAPEKRDHVAVETSLRRSAELLRIVDAELETQPYLSGTAFAMGDIPLGSFIYSWFNLPIDRPHLPGLAEWYERLKQRPAYRRAVMTPLT